MRKWDVLLFMNYNIARHVRQFSINYPDFNPRFTLLWISPPSRPHCTAPSLQSTLQNKAGCVNLTTPTVICSVIHKQHWSHKCGCQYIHYNSAPYTHHNFRFGFGLRFGLGFGLGFGLRFGFRFGLGFKIGT